VASLATFPALIGVVLVLLIVVLNDGANDNVYFDRLRCAGRYYSDIYEIPAADTAS
jgi:hypothetical protein